MSLSFWQEEELVAAAEARVVAVSAIEEQQQDPVGKATNQVAEVMNELPKL